MNGEILNEMRLLHEELAENLREMRVWTQELIRRDMFPSILRKINAGIEAGPLDAVAITERLHVDPRELGMLSRGILYIAVCVRLESLGYPFEFDIDYFRRVGDDGLLSPHH